MNDETPEIEDVDFSSSAADLTAGMEQLSHQDVDAAAQAVITAAAEARAREFDYGGETNAPDDWPQERTYDIVTAYHDKSTGELWIYYGNNIFYVYPDEFNRTGGVPKYYAVEDPTQPEPSQFEWIRPKFEYFGERWPSYPLTMAQHCDAAKAEIQSGQMTPLVSVKDAVLFWRGDARDDFKDYFLNPYMMNAVTNQQTLLDELAVAMYAYEGILKQGRVDAKTIADQAVDHLDALNVGSGTDWKTVFGVVGVVVSVITTVATAGSTTALTLGLIGATVSGGSLIAADQTVEGAYTEEVLDSLSEVLDLLRQAMEHEEQILADQLAISADTVNGHLASNDPLDVATVLPNEPSGGVPNLTDGEMPDPDDFHPRG